MYECYIGKAMYMSIGKAVLTLVYKGSTVLLWMMIHLLVSGAGQEGAGQEGSEQGLAVGCRGGEQALGCNSAVLALLAFMQT